MLVEAEAAGRDLREDRRRAAGHGGPRLLFEDVSHRWGRAWRVPLLEKWGHEKRFLERRLNRQLACVRTETTGHIDGGESCGNRPRVGERRLRLREVVGRPRSHSEEVTGSEAGSLP